MNCGNKRACGIVHQIKNMHNGAPNVFLPRQNYDSMTERNRRILDCVGETGIIPFDHFNGELLRITKIDAYEESGKFYFQGFVSAEFENRGVGQLPHPLQSERADQGS